MNHKANFITIFLISLLCFSCQKKNNFTVKGESRKIVEEAETLFLLEEEIKPDPTLIDYQVELPPSFTNDVWENTGGEADHTYHHLSMLKEPKLIWRNRIAFNYKSFANRLPQPVVSEKYVFAMDEFAFVSAFDIETGKKVWTKQFNKLENEEINKKKKSFGILGGLSYGDGVLYVASGYGIISALSEDDGYIIWQKRLPEQLRHAPTLFDGQLYIVTITNELWVYDVTNGEVKWRNGSFNEPVKVVSNVAPAVVEDMAIVPFSSGEIMSLNPTNGRIYWNDALGRSSNLNNITSIVDIAASPVIDREMVFVSGHSGLSVAYDRIKGDLLWSNDFISTNTPWVSGDVIFYLTNQQKIICIRRIDGAVIWVSQLPEYKNIKEKKEPYAWLGPIAGGDLIYSVSNYGDIITLNPIDGELVARKNVKANFVSSPVIVNEAMYLLDAEGFVFKFK